MRHPAVWTLLALLVALSAGAIQARVAPPPPLPERLVQADVVVAGKVTRIEEKSLTLPDGEERRIAVVQVEEALRGGGGVTHLRVAFRDAPPGRRGVFPQVSVGLRACFFLGEVPGHTWYTVPTWYDVAPLGEGADVETQLKLLRRCARLLDQAPRSLEAADAGERYLTAALLILRYRSPRPGQSAQAPIDPRESKLILLALADADWGKPDPALPRMEPQSLFFRLGVTPADGFQRPGNFKDFPEAARKWLRTHADTYRIKRFVAGAPTPR